MTDKKELYSGKFLRLCERNGWEFVERARGRDGVMIVPLTTDDCFILVEEWREPIQKHVINFPAGVMGDKNDSESIVEAASRELEEETGYFLKAWDEIATIATSAGLSSEALHIVPAYDCYKFSAGGGVENEGEHITVHKVPFNCLYQWLHAKKRNGSLVGAALWMFAFGLFTAGQLNRRRLNNADTETLKEAITGVYNLLETHALFNQKD